MKLYKNVPIRDLENILKYGILPVSKTGNERKDINRTDNSIDVVYLAKPITKFNSSTHYGDVLIEVEVDNPTKTEFLENDRNYLYYQEYVTDEVSTNQIKGIYIPKKFVDDINQISNPHNVNITFVDVVEEYGDLLSIYDGVEIETNIKNYIPENLETVVDEFGKKIIIDKSTKIVKNYSNKDKTVSYQAMKYDEKHDFVDYFWADFKQTGTIDDIELKINIKRNIINSAFKNHISKLSDNLTIEMLKDFIKNNQSQFFTKKGDWKQNALNTIKKLSVDDFYK